MRGLPFPLANDKGHYHSRNSLCEQWSGDRHILAAEHGRRIETASDGNRTSASPAPDIPGADLTQTIYQIEKSVKGVPAAKYAAVLESSGAKAEGLGAAGLIKQLAGQINVVIH